MTHRSVRIAAAAALSVALVAGCSGKTIEGTSKSAEPEKPDISQLDTGAYPTEPRALGRVSTEEEGRLVEAIRMMEAVADFPTIDPALVHSVHSSPVVSAQAMAENISLTGDAVLQPVLEKNGMVTGYFASASDVKLDVSEESVGTPETDPKVLFVVLIRFPDEESAKTAAKEMDAADFAVSNENVRVPITKYPDAHAHWRPTFPSMAATMAHREFVVHTVAIHPTTNFGALAGQMAKTFDVEIPLIDKFKATPVDDIAALHRDPDGVLGRTQYDAAGELPEISPGFRVVGPHGAKSLQDPEERKEGLFDKTGVDRFAFSVNGSGGYSSVVRTRGSSAAVEFVDGTVRLDEDIDHPIDGPKGVPTAKCFEQKLDVWADNPVLRFLCYVTYDNYVGAVFSADEADVKLRAAAQYALLVNDRTGVGK